MSLRSAAEAALHVLESMVGKCDGSHIVRGRVLDKMCARCELRAALSAPDELAEARQCFEVIARLGGNVSDEHYTDRTGPNDAAHRGLMYCEARRIARDFLKRTEGQK